MEMMDQAVETGPGNRSKGASQKHDEGMSPALQGHIGRHVRAAFDKVAQEPIPEHLLRLLKDLDRSGEK
jgi:hypothetical protein